MGGTRGAGMCDLRPQSQQQGGGLGPLGTLPATALESQSQDRKEPMWSQGISPVPGMGCSKRPPHRAPRCSVPDPDTSLPSTWGQSWTSRMCLA